MLIICQDRQKTIAPKGRALNPVVSDINKLLSPKTHEQLETLEGQVKRKLNSDEPIDYDYWEELLRSLAVWKARAKLKKVYQAVIDKRVRGLRKQQCEEAESVRQKLALLAPTISSTLNDDQLMDPRDFEDLDPEPLLQIRPEDKYLQILDESAFLNQAVTFPPTLLLLFECPS